MLTIISEHMLLPNPEMSFEFPESPFPWLPLVSVRGIQIDMVELEYHGELLALFGHVLTGLVLAYTAWHLANGATCVLA